MQLIRSKGILWVAMGYRRVLRRDVGRRKRRISTEGQTATRNSRTNLHQNQDVTNNFFVFVSAHQEIEALLAQPN